MDSPQINGEVQQGAGQSALIRHIFEYPFVNDGITVVRSNPYGKKSLELGDSAYRTFAAPFLPYLSRPYQFVSPYVKKADDICDKTLTRVDERFPVVRKPTDELYQDVRNLALSPYHLGLAGKDHILETYTSAKSKTGGDNYITYGKALVSTAMTVAMEAVDTVTNVLHPKGKGAQNTDGLNGNSKPSGLDSA